MAEPGSPHRSGLWRYVAGWLVAGVALALGGVALLHHERAGGGAASTVAVPPLRASSLETAIRRSHCTMATRAAATARAPGGRVRPGVYGHPLPLPAREAALRRGVIVIEYRPGLDRRMLAELRTLQQAVPSATIVAPASPSAARATLVVSSARRELRCGRVDADSIDALRLFRGRFVGIHGA